jgi:hypothetical protein
MNNSTYDDLIPWIYGKDDDPPDEPDIPDVNWEDPEEENMAEIETINYGSEMKPNN